MARIDSFLRLVVEQQASDLHFHAGNVPIIRHDGDLVPLPFRILSEEETRRFLFEIMTRDQRESFERDQELDFAYVIEGIGRFRVNAFQQSHGPGAVFRIIPARLPTLDELRLPPSLGKLALQSHGLVLITGPTGSGKTTTLAAIIHEINTSSKRHVITVEDPIEFVHRSKKCLVNQRELGFHTHSFANALRAALREDPDIILVGEMRDLETIQLALTAAETGHLVFGTLHTSSAPKTVDRVIDVFPPSQQSQIRAQFAESIEAVITQTLLKKKAGDGRVAALEVMTGTTAIRNLIREGKIHQIPGTMQVSQKDGMQTMDMALVDLASRGVVTQEEAQSRSMTPNLFGSGAFGVGGVAASRARA